ncbi:MaoC family dehydratase [Bradyrhizobium commune]|uniref:MaoC family dehydratase n=1 Tax=Bradyrhizobium commune TaxID=83627 RepID=A0A7S9GYL4_9BRAD|nr:MaoC family dehydratase [Bradyrhizobium commune]QPF90719.1 MaoC family dehydratase [Bradyrhizobium commune]
MSASRTTLDTNYYEDFTVGEVIKHGRGKTLDPLENVLITNLVMNTSSAHFNEHLASQMPFGRRVVFGGVTFALMVGLASQDTSENALAEISVEKIAFKAPVHHGTNIYAYSEVLEKQDTPDREDGGVVRFRHWAVTDTDQIVCEAERTVLVKRRSHWCPA